MADPVGGSTFAFKKRQIKNKGARKRTQSSSEGKCLLQIQIYANSVLIWIDKEKWYSSIRLS